MEIRWHRDDKFRHDSDSIQDTPICSCHFRRVISAFTPRRSPAPPTTTPVLDGANYSGVWAHQEQQRVFSAKKRSQLATRTCSPMRRKAEEWLPNTPISPHRCRLICPLLIVN
eukprot:3859270-Pleurochrysis_carterae.AAC.3